MTDATDATAATPYRSRSGIGTQTSTCRKRLAALVALLGVAALLTGCGPALTPARRALLLRGDGSRVQVRHDDHVVAVAWSPDGAWLATASVDGTARVIDPASGRERIRVTHDGPVVAVAWSPDGAWLATTGIDGTARVADPASGRERPPATHGPPAPVHALAWSPDGARLATAGYDGTARVVDAASGRVRARVSHDPPDGYVVALAWSPDGAWLATAGGDGTARVVDAASGKERARVTHHGPQAVARAGDEVIYMDGPAPVYAVAWSPDGARLATAAGDGARVVPSPAGGSTEG